MSKRDAHGDVETMAEVRELHDDNGDEYASHRVWSALNLAISVIDQMRPYLMRILQEPDVCFCAPNYRCLRCSAEELLKKID